MRIRVEPRQHDDEGVEIDLLERAQARGPHGRPRIADRVDHDAQRPLVLQHAQCRDRFEAQVGIGIARLGHGPQRRGRVAAADLRKRTDRRHGDSRVRPPALRERNKGAGAACRFARTEPSGGEGPRHAAAAAQQGGEGGNNARVVGPREGVGDRPPGDARLPRRVEHHRHERVGRLEPRQREDGEAERTSGGVERGRPVISLQCRRLHRRQVDGGHRRDGLRRVGVADEPERFGRAPLHEHRRVAQRRPQRLHRQSMADEAHREGGHLPHLGVAIAGQHRRQRRHAVGEPDASDGLRRAAAHPPFRVPQELEQIGRRRKRRRDLTGAAALRRGLFGNRLHRRRRGGAEDALVLEPEYPGHLLFEGQRRRQGLSRLGGHAVRDREHEQTGQTRRARVHRVISRRRIVARSTRSSATCTPIPSPSGTGIVPSGPTSIGGSTRSGS